MSGFLVEPKSASHVGILGLHAWGIEQFIQRFLQPSRK